MQGKQIGPGHPLFEALSGSLMGSEGAQFLQRGQQRKQLPVADIVERLRLLHAMQLEKHTFEPGQILQYKKDDFPENDGSPPALFVGYLPGGEVLSAWDFAKSQHDLHSDCAAAEYDCRIMTTDDGGTTGEFLADSREFRPHPDFPVA